MYPDRERFAWFLAYAREVIARCRRVATSVPGFSDQPCAVYVPGGDDKYPSFWIRDAVMTCQSGLIGSATMQTMLRIMLTFQNGPQRRDLAHGLRVDPWAIPDHINLPGLGSNGAGAVFFPGTYSPIDDQGDGRFGLRPADDNIYEVAELTRLIVGRLPTGERFAFLRSEVREVPIIERLHRGITAMTVEPASGLCWNSPGDWAAASFHDSLKPMGAIALTSVLRFRAARAMAGFYTLMGDKASVQHYQQLAEQLARSVIAQLRLPSGWLMVGSELDRQPDLWSTAMAVYYGLLNGDDLHAASTALLRAYRDGTLCANGYLRHTPTAADAVPGQRVWEDDSGDDSAGYGTYQNGGYWPQPLGYFCYALTQVDPSAAAQVAGAYVDHTRALAASGAPFEWLNPALTLEQTPALGRWYGPAVALPLAGFRRLSSVGSFRSPLEPAQRGSLENH